MSGTDHTDDRFAAVQARMVDLAREQCGMNEQTALKFVSQVLVVMQQEFAGDRVYFPRPKSYDESAVLADVDAGAKPTEICQRHHISRDTYYRVLRKRTGTGG